MPEPSKATSSLKMAAPHSICKVFAQGGCKQGDKCRFLHASNITVPKERLTRGDMHRKKKQEASIRALLKGTKDLLSSLEPSDLEMNFDKEVRLINYQFLASYNWVDRKEPTILVPGAPPRWNPPKLPAKLARDIGRVFIDQNAQRSPASSFEPLFKSIRIMQPDFNMAPISLATDRNNLRKLFKFACGEHDRSFRIDVSMVHGTMFFRRWEEKSSLIMRGFIDSGYGHEFEKAFTVFDKGLKNSSGHHRIVQYELGNINCLVRFEADAYINKLPGSKPEAEMSPATDEVAPHMNKLSLRPGERGGSSSTSIKEVVAIQKGRLVSLSHVIEMKSRAVRKKIRMRDVIPQLWFAQTQNLFVGYHQEGLVKEVTQIEMATRFKAWEAEHQQQLMRLVSLIGRIRETAEGAEGGRCVVVYRVDEKPRMIKIYRTDKRDLVVSEDVKSECWR